MKARTLAAVGVLVAVVGAGVAAARTHTVRPTVRVSSAVLREQVIARAEVVPMDGVARVRARTEGRVLRVLVREGDRVTAGQLLAELESDALATEVQRRQAEEGALAASVEAVAQPAPREELAVAESEAAAARQEYDLARDRAQREEHLRQSGAVSETDARTLRAAAEVAHQRLAGVEARVAVLRRGGRTVDVRIARARERAAEAAVDLAQSDLARSRITAPVAGVVLTRRIDPGDTVTLTATAASEPLFELADPTRVEVRAEVEETDAARVAVGMHAMVALVGTDHRLGEGTLTRISPRLERRRVGVEDVRVRAEGVVRTVWITPMEDTRGLPLGQRLDAFIDLGPRRVEATVPRAAVRVEDGRALVRTPTLAGLWGEDHVVHMGVATDTRVEITGLRAGTVVELQSDTR